MSSHSLTQNAQHLLWLLCALTILSGWCLHLSSPQASTTHDVRLTPQQIQQLDQGIDMVRAGHTQQALDLYTQMLKHQDFNLLHLNRGRLLYYQGQCEAADQAFAKAARAPHLKGIDPQEIFQPLKRYQQELNLVCQEPFLMTINTTPTSLGRPILLPNAPQKPT